MSELSLREFEDPGFDVKLGDYISAIEAYSHMLEPDQVNRLREIIGERVTEKVVYDASFNLRDEVQAQIACVRALRESVLPGGVVRAGLAAREIKEAVTASSTLLSTLMKTHKDILSLDRARCIEEAVSETIKTLSDEDRATFMKKLEENLSAIE